MNSEKLIYCKLLEEKEFLEAKIEYLTQKIKKKEQEIDSLIKMLRQKIDMLKSTC